MNRKDFMKGLLALAAGASVVSAIGAQYNAEQPKPQYTPEDTNANEMATAEVERIGKEEIERRKAYAERYKMMYAANDRVFSAADKDGVTRYFTLQFNDGHGAYHALSGTHLLHMPKDSILSIVKESHKNPVINFYRVHQEGNAVITSGSITTL